MMVRQAVDESASVAMRCAAPYDDSVYRLFLGYTSTALRLLLVCVGNLEGVSACVMASFSKAGCCAGGPIAARRAVADLPSAMIDGGSRAARYLRVQHGGREAQGDQRKAKNKQTI